MTTELRSLPVVIEGQTWPLFLAQGQQEPLVKDLDLGAWLEFERPRKIRELIGRYSDELGGARMPASGRRPWQWPRRRRWTRSARQWRAMGLRRLADAQETAVRFRALEAAYNGITHAGGPR